MKIVVVGIGQCGCNIADSFYDLNRYTKSIFDRKIEIVTDAFAINSDTTDLSGIVSIPANAFHRPSIGTSRTFGHGAGKDNVLGAKLMRESIRVLDNVRQSKKFGETDAVVVVAAAAGGTGSGGIGVAVEILKQRLERPVYAILVLPFLHEETEDLTVKNTAICLNTLINEAQPDALFLLDNRRLGRGSSTVRENFRQINDGMVTNFYDLFCAGEETKSKYVGGKVVDAGDIIKSLEGPTVIGRASVPLSVFHKFKQGHFRESAKIEANIIEALRQAKDKMGLELRSEDVGKLMWLFCAPREYITLKMEEQLTSVLKEKFPKAEIRYGNYPRLSREIAITLVASKLTESQRMRNLFSKGKQAVIRIKEKEEVAEEKIKDLYSAGEGLPKL